MDENVKIKLSEKEAKHLLDLVREELERTDKVWAPYWLKIMRSIQDALERAGYSSDPFEKKGK